MFKNVQITKIKARMKKQKNKKMEGENNKSKMKW